MRSGRKYVLPVGLFLWVAALSAGCSLVDEDMRDCETDYTLDYELQLVTNMTTELQTELSMAADVTVAQALRSHFAGVFTDRANDVDLSFYDVAGDSTRLHHEAHVMNASETSYTLYIPVRKYMHLALANLADNGQVTLRDDGTCHGAQLRQEGDTLDSQKTGLFTARLPMEIQEGINQSFDVHLYMANSALALVLDTLGSKVRNVQMYAKGFATDFNLCDSTYRFRYTPVIRSEKVDLAEPGSVCLATVTFPSRNPDDTKVVIDTDDPFTTTTAGASLYQVMVYVSLPDGTVTESIVGVTRPLCAGQLKVIKARARDDGRLECEDPTVGISCTLEWTPGNTDTITL